jgi:hypothetical protein
VSSGFEGITDDTEAAETAVLFWGLRPYSSPPPKKTAVSENSAPSVTPLAPDDPDCCHPVSKGSQTTLKPQKTLFSLNSAPPKKRTAVSEYSASSVTPLAPDDPDCCHPVSKGSQTILKPQKPLFFFLGFAFLQLPPQKNYSF